MVLLPRPHSVKAVDGTLYLCPRTAIVLCGAHSRRVWVSAQQLQADIRLYTGLMLPLRRGEPDEGDILLRRSEVLPAQSYTLRITEKGVAIEGGGDAGILHGVQTLRQIVAGSGAALPLMDIEDRPLFQHRGFYHDVTRGRVPTLESLKQLVDNMALYKLNQLQLYVEHTYLFQGFSEIWRTDTPLTAEEILELDVYCDDRGIELIPSVNGFGHMFEILRSKSYRSLCEMEDIEAFPPTYHNRMHHHTINVTDERALPFVTAMLEEYMPLFRSSYVNICADETFDLGKGKSQQAARDKGTDRLYMDFLKSLCECVQKHGKIPMFWGDILVRMPEMHRELPKGAICLNWGYGAEESDEGIRKLAEIGAVQYVCPGVSGWNRWMNMLRTSYENITRMCRYGREYGAIGVLNTDWGDYGHINHPPFSMPGLIYGATFSWSKEELPFEQINADISHLLYRDPIGMVMSDLTELSESIIYPWEDLVRFMDAVRGGEDLLLAHATFLARHVSSRVPAKNAQADRALAALCRLSAGMDTSARGILQAWSVAGEAIRVWNLVGAYVTTLTAGEAVSSPDPALASRLEHWYRLYAEVWSSVSKQSELHRIGEIVCWFSDLLRG